MTPSDFNPQKVAKEAAEKLLTANWPTMSCYATLERCQEARRLMVTDAILSAAARMVRESGAVEALAILDGYLVEDMPEGPAKADLRSVTEGYRDAYAKVLAALASLRCITEGKES